MITMTIVIVITITITITLILMITIILTITITIMMSDWRKESIQENEMTASKTDDLYQDLEAKKAQR